MIKLGDNCPTCGNKYVHEVDCPESRFANPENTVDERAILLRFLRNLPKPIANGAVSPDHCLLTLCAQNWNSGKVVDRFQIQHTEQIVDDYLAARGVDADLEALANAEIKTEVGSFFLSGGLAVPPKPEGE